MYPPLRCFLLVGVIPLFRFLLVFSLKLVVILFQSTIHIIINLYSIQSTRNLSLHRRFQEILTYGKNLSARRKKQKIANKNAMNICVVIECFRLFNLTLRVKQSLLMLEVNIKILLISYIDKQWVQILKLMSLISHQN